MTALEVELFDPQGRVEHLQFDRTQLIWLGRDADCDIVLSTQNISRRHASVQGCDDGLCVTDCSSNGTLVNDLPLRQGSRLVAEPECTLKLGSHRLRLRDKKDRNDVALVRGLDRGSESSTDELLGPDLRRALHKKLLEYLDLFNLDRDTMDPDAIRPSVLCGLRRIVADTFGQEKSPQEQERLVQELCHEALGLGPLEALLTDPAVSEIMVVDARTIFAERRGRIERTGLRFTDDDSVRAVIERIVTPLGRRIDESTPLVDARLRDGSRVNAVIPPLSVKGPCITIRKFAKDPLSLRDLIQRGSVSTDMASFLDRSVKVRKNILISGGTGSGKTTLLNALSGAVPALERIVTVEDAAELQLAQSHVVSLESRPANLEGLGQYTIRDLVKNALRMRPDRIIVGECRGGEAIDMLQAMNTGHEGSMTTTHANSPREAIARVETLCLMAGVDLPIQAVRQQIASSIHLVVQMARFYDGMRRITSVAEVAGIDDDGTVELRTIFEFCLETVGSTGDTEGEFVRTGYLPSYLDQFIAHGLSSEEDCL